MHKKMATECLVSLLSSIENETKQKRNENETKTKTKRNENETKKNDQLKTALKRNISIIAMIS